MELKTESDKTQPRDKAIVYQAIGWIVGRYQPSADNPDCGMLLTEDGQTIPAQVSWQLHKHLRRKFGEVLQTTSWHGDKFLWTVYPRTEPLRVQLVNINLLQPLGENATNPEAEQAKSKQAEGLKIVGQIEWATEGKIRIIVRRNEKPPRGRENDVEYQPSVLQIVGSVPDEAVGQIWELEVQRQKAELVVVTGKQYTPVATRFRARKRNRASAPALAKKAIDRTLPLPKPIKRIKLQTDLPLTAGEQEEAAKQQEDSLPPVLPQSSANESMLPTTNAGTSKTVGKIEVVVKLNELPDDVKTVDTWKEFDVDTGEAIVTITVKPKTFGLLEQAQQAYPRWVAAISGQMGQMTAKGFRLESAAIKVFERKATGSSPNEGNTTKKSEPSPATLTSLVIAQPSEINLESKSLAQRVPNAESLQSPKTLPSRERQQQNKTALRTGQPLPTAQTASASGQANFTVQVNAQVFVGHNSVTLNRRVLCIDGKPVAQSKLAVVIGQPDTMQADGSVTKGNDRSVLMSK